MPHLGARSRALLTAAPGIRAVRSGHVGPAWPAPPPGSSAVLSRRLPLRELGCVQLATLKLIRSFQPACGPATKVAESPGPVPNPRYYRYRDTNPVNRTVNVFL